METISDDAKKSIVKLLNKSLQIEYDFLFGYPRVVEKLVKIDKINDKQLIDTIETLIKESIRHFDDVDKVIKNFGGETIWHINVVGWSIDVEECLRQLLDRENWVLSWYKEAKGVAERNKVKVRGFLGRPVRSSDALPEDFVNVDDIISMLERHIMEEENHVRLCTDAIDRLLMLKNK